jgi:hypothetical protein
MTAPGFRGPPGLRPSRTRGQKTRPGKPLPVPPLPEEFANVKWGPAMRALSDRGRAFVLALFSVAPGFGAAVRAAQEACYGTTTSTPQSMASIASGLMHDEKILAAVREHSERYIKNSAPRALTALMNLIEDPSSRDHARGIAMLLDRVHPVESHHSIDVQHTVTVDHRKETLDSLRAFKRLGVSRERLLEIFGFSGLSIYERELEREDAEAAGQTPRLIEGTATEVRP